ncbi:cation:proton antiporter [Synechocystis salina LEGE 06155]|nr:cation:proton antiporter [Synechocystis salina LEGE 06155]
MFQSYADWAIIAVFIVFYSLIAKAIGRTWISDAMVFVVAGFLLGDDGLGWLDFNVTSENLETIVELTLALILFTDAANANLPVLKNSLRLPWRLLAIGLPLTIALGFGVSSLLFPQFSWVEAALLAVMLAPTDAALGKAVVSNTQVPDNIREDLNVESGLNDGICVPLLLSLLAIADSQQTQGIPTSLLASLFLQQIGIGVLIGVSFAFIATQMRHFFLKKNWAAQDWQPVLPIALAVACFATSQQLGGSGFIACFVGGLTFGGLNRQQRESLLIAAEGAGDALSLITWVAFGSSIVVLVFAQITWQAVVYGLLSLTIVRMVPVAIALLGLKQNLYTVIFAGWFGPRGLASIVFAVMVLDARLPYSQEIAVVVSLTIIFSVIAHGLSATPLANRYGRWWSQHQVKNPSH